MDAFEWMELQSLTSDVAAARARLASARSAKDRHLIRSLEQEITAAEERRTQLLAHLTTHIAASGPASPPTGGDPRPAPRMTGGDAAVTVCCEEGEEARLPGRGAPAASDDSNGGGDSVVWDQLTPADLERAKGTLGERRSEMLVRHAAELKALDADRRQLDALEQAIASFLQKFAAASSSEPAAAAAAAAAAAVVTLDHQRELRMHG